MVVLDSVDRTLHSKLQLVKGLMHDDGNDIEFEIDEIVQGEYVIPRSGHYYQIFVDGEIAIASDSLVDETFNLSSGNNKSYDDEAREWMYVSIGPADEPIRIIRHEFEFLGKSINIMVAERLTESLAMIAKINQYFIIMIPIMVLFVGFVGLIIAYYSLRPLESFSSTIGKITHETLNKRIEQGYQVKELQFLTESFNLLLTRLQVAFESEKNLIADAAHELKTPLAVMGMQCDVSLQKQRPKEEYVDSLKTIKSLSKSMLLQINSMLTLARLDSGILSVSSFKKVSLSRCIENAILLSKPLTNLNNIKINFNINQDINIFCHDNSLTEALQNLIENAVRYNNVNGLVEITANKEDNQVTITINDTGIGINEEEQGRIFDRFYRSENTRGMEGTGLGLPIALAIIQYHHGKIEIKSKAYEGSSFIITLPLQ